MLAYVLALMVGFGSVSLYLAAFFFPEVYRRYDLPWSGVGLFYALVLWVCADRITGGLLLGEAASVALISWLAWQTLTLRRQTTPLEQQTSLPDTTALQASLTSVPAQLKARFSQLTAATPAIAPAEEPYVPLTRADFGPTGREAIEADTQRQQAASERAARRAARSSAAASNQVVTGTESVPVRALQPERSSKAAPQSRPETVSPASDSKPVYVRKRFRKAGEEPSATPDAAPVSSVPASVPASKVAASNAALQENMAEIVSLPSLAADAIVDSAQPADAVIQSEIVHEAELTAATPDYELRVDYELRPAFSQTASQRRNRGDGATPPQDSDESSYETYE